MLLFFIRKTKEHPKEFKIKVKFSSLPEEEKKKLLFEVFDLALSSKRKTKSKGQHLKGRPMFFLTEDMVRQLFSADPISPLANK